MKIVKQSSTLPVCNIDSFTESNNNNLRKHGVLLPETCRCIISGPSNCGKTNVMMSLLQEPNGLKFENVYVFSKSLYQPKYKFLEKVLKPIKGLGYYTFSENDDVVSPDKAKPHSVILFDDIACDKQNNIRKYFSMGRHNDIDCFYLCQTYTRIPKHLIRDNANLLVLFKQDEMNLRHVYQDHVSTDMDFTKFRGICAECWKTPYGFLVINKDCDLHKGRYRKGFDSYIYL